MILLFISSFCVFEIVQSKKMGEREKEKTLNMLIACERKGKEQSGIISHVLLDNRVDEAVIILEMETQEEKQDWG